MFLSIYHALVMQQLLPKSYAPHTLLTTNRKSFLLSKQQKE